MALALLALSTCRGSQSRRAGLGSRNVLEPQRRGTLLCQGPLRRGPRGPVKRPAALTSAARRWVPSLTLTGSSLTTMLAMAGDMGPLPALGLGQRTGVQGRRLPGKALPVGEWSLVGASETTSRHHFRGPQANPAPLRASICPLFWEGVVPKGRPCWLWAPQQAAEGRRPQSPRAV